MAEEAVKIIAGNAAGQASEPCLDSGSDAVKTNACIKQTDSAKQIASWLAESFSSLRKRQKRLKTLKDFGPMKYTEDMAIADLTSISVNTGSDKVQTSSISKIPERVALMLSSGYVEKMQEKMNQEYEDLCSELEYVSWQLDIIDAAMEERMTERQRVVFRWIYLEKMSLRYIHDNLMPEFSTFTIKETRDKALLRLETEVKMRATRDIGNPFFSQIHKEVEKELLNDRYDGESDSSIRKTNRRPPRHRKAQKAGKTEERVSCITG